jgi:hypothetical protein
LDTNLDHAANALARDLWRTGRAPTPAEIEILLARIASAPFNEKMAPVDRSIAGMPFQGRPLRIGEPSIRAHLAKRVLLDEQWIETTTEATYLSDLRRVAAEETTGVAVYRFEKRIVVAVVGPNGVPAARRGVPSLPLLLAIYDSGRGRLVTGFQIRSELDVDVPEGVQWRPSA